MNKDNAKLARLLKSLKSIGIELELQANLPWVYIVSINGNLIPEEEWTANHGYNLGFISVKRGEGFRFSDVSKTFKLIRKYR